MLGDFTTEPQLEALGHRPAERRLPLHTDPRAFLSTPSDLVRFGMAINSGKLLQPATVHVVRDFASYEQRRRPVWCDGDCRAGIDRIERPTEN